MSAGNRGFGPWDDKLLALPDGAWRFDPFAKVMRFVPAPNVADNWAELDVRPQDCGTKKGYAFHIRYKEPTCSECRAAHAAERLRIAREKGYAHRELQPCGTRAAYQRHIRDGSVPCDDCRAAERDHAAMRRAERKAA